MCALCALSALRGGVDGPASSPGREKYALCERKEREGVVSSSLKELSPLFHQDAQISYLINLSTLPLACVL